MIPAEVQHGEQAWPRLAPGRLLGMGLVFLKFFIFWKRRQMVRSALGSSSSAERQGDLGRGC
ncbi:unnamed protein product [Prunus armeniaca]